MPHRTWLRSRLILALDFMTKDLATFQREYLDRLLLALESLGYRYFHPIRNEITAWDSRGEEVVLTLKQEAIDFLRNGKGGVQLWSSSEEDVFISIAAGKVRLYFDGFTQSEQDVLIKLLLDQGLLFTVTDEDTAFEV